MANRVTLAVNGKSDWRVVYMENASACEKFAAEEFVRLFREITGVVLPLASDGEPETGCEIVIGRGTRAPKGSLPGVGPGRTDEDVAISVCPEQIYIHGAGTHGVLYGVYCFFEELAGVRYVAPDKTAVPKREAFSVPHTTMHITPSVALRYFAFRSCYGPAYLASNRINMTWGESDFDPKYGLPGKAEYPLGHSIANFVPENLFEEHPEYFPEINGVRETGRHHQRCLSNPDVYRLCVERVRETLRAHPGQRAIAIGQNDTYPDKPNNCQCALCRAKDEEEGSPMGSLLRFVNAVAEELEEEFPDVVFNTLAYRYTRKAPRITRPRHNVCIVLCSIECCFSHPMLPDCGADMRDATNAKVSNSEFVKDLQDWSAIADKLIIWDYVTNFAHYLAPHPNLHVLGPNLRLMIENNAYGYYPEGAHDCVGAEMDELRSYVLAQLAWKQDQDADLLIDEYLIGRIGMAAAPVGKYIRDLRDRVTRQNYHMSTYATPSKELFSTEWLAFAEAMFDRAEQLAPDEEALTVVQRMRMSVRYVKICLYDTEKTEPEKRAIADEFMADMQRLNIWKVHEGGTMEGSRAKVEKLLGLA